jgi:hypothetical protein
MAEILDAVERGEAVVVERRGRRFSIRAEQATGGPKRRRRSLIEWMDPAVEAGQWTWDWSPGRMKFKRRLKKR